MKWTVLVGHETVSGAAMATALLGKGGGNKQRHGWSAWIPARLSMEYGSQVKKTLNEKRQFLYNLVDSPRAV